MLSSFDLRRMPTAVKRLSSFQLLAHATAALLILASCQAERATPPVTSSFEFKVSKKASGLLLLDSTALQDSDVTFEKTALFYGLTIRKVDLSRESLTTSQLVDESGNYYRAIAINYQSLDKAGLLSDASLGALKEAVGSGANLLVSGVSPNPEGSDSPGLLALTGNSIRGARKPKDSSRDWQVESAFPEATLEFTGQRVLYGKEPQEDFALNVEEGSGDAVPLITSRDDKGDTYPILARYRWGRGSLFLDASRTGNLQSNQMWVLYNSRYFGRLVPTMMFVRYAFGEMAWHSPYRFANLTVDDPALTEPWYSFSYRQLLQQMERQGLHTTIAMPPGMYQQAQKEVIDLFLANPERFSLVPHGNDHEEYEFYKYATQPADPYPARPLLGQERDIVEALTRMEELKRATGLPYGKVMVFPYNIAPAPTIALLKKYGFAATVNAANLPLEETPRQNYDFNMYPAVMEYGTFPLLDRYTPESLPYPFLFFLGRPALFFEHIDFFKDRREVLDRLAADMGKDWGRGPVQWKSLDYIVKRLYLEKINEDGGIDVKFFTNNLVLTNQSVQARTYNLWKAEGLEVPIERVEMDGIPIPYKVADGWLSTRAEIEANSSKELAIIYGGGLLPDLALSPTSISYDKSKGILNIEVENRGEAEGPVPLALYDGENNGPLLITAIEAVPNRQKVTAQIDLRKLPAKTNFRLKLDPFSVVKETRLDNNEARVVTPEAATTILDNFEYDDSPAGRGWTAEEGQGSLRTVYDREAASRVLEMSSRQELTYKVNYPPAGQALAIPRRFLRVNFKATEDFQFFVRVIGVDGKGYYLQFTSQDGHPNAHGEYMVYPLGARVKDGKWHTLERDLDTDLRGLLSRVEYFVIRGSVRLDDLTLSSQRSAVP